MYKHLKRPLLAATFGASISIPIYYYAIMKSPLSNTGQPLSSSSTQSSIPPPTTTTTKTPIQNAPSSSNGTISSSGNNNTTTTTTITQLSTPYTATFSVPLHCENCTSSLSTALHPLPGVHSLSFSIPHSLLTITGTAPPSAIIRTIQATGRTAILRGSGRPDSAAVCILETPPSPPRLRKETRHISGIDVGDGDRDRNGGGESEERNSQLENTVRGLARLIELNERVTMLDLTLTGLAPGRWRASVRAKGDVSRGRESVGPVWRGYAGDKEGEVGEVDVAGDGRAGLVAEVGWRVWEVVGRGVLVERVGGGTVDGDDGGDEVVMGVVARSAGVWENEKVVCSCSGKTVWEEREEMVKRGMV